MSTQIFSVCSLLNYAAIENTNDAELLTATWQTQLFDIYSVFAGKSFRIYRRRYLCVTERGRDKVVATQGRFFLIYHTSEEQSL